MTIYYFTITKPPALEEEAYGFFLVLLLLCCGCLFVCFWQYNLPLKLPERKGFVKQDEESKDRREPNAHKNSVMSLKLGCKGCSFFT